MRFGSAGPKQFEILHGRPLLSYSLERLAGLGPSGIGLVLPATGLTAEVSEVVVDARKRFPEVPIHTVEGGPRRQDSVARGLRSMDAPADVVLVHDSARPFPPIEATQLLIQRAHEVGGGLLAIPVVDTVKQEGPPGRVARTLDRTGLWLAQTPQAFRGQFLRSVEHLLEGDILFTDEAAALEHLDIPVALVPGDPMNLKVTRPEDLRRAAAALSSGLFNAQPGAV
jgi:2-C-methyl-D-erythritol 4-phosphate cytidylyltransferase